MSRYSYYTLFNQHTTQYLVLWPLLAHIWGPHLEENMTFWAPVVVKGVQKQHWPVVNFEVTYVLVIYYYP